LFDFLCEIERIFDWIGISIIGFSLIVGCLPFTANQCAIKKRSMNCYVRSFNDLPRILMSKGNFGWEMVKSSIGMILSSIEYKIRFSFLILRNNERWILDVEQ
jgi:hypothetical protein